MREKRYSLLFRGQHAREWIGHATVAYITEQVRYILTDKVLIVLVVIDFVRKRP